ncbi:MAG: protoporphyrinogen oxidase [Acidimicrobiales bacterium]
MSTTPGTAAIIGGGISGLVAAFDLHRAGWKVDVYEASDRWGGKVYSSMVGDRLIDAGPDTFLARVPQGRQLCVDLGLAAELTSPVSPVPAYIHRNGSLHPLPGGTVLGVPTDLTILAESGVVSDAAVARAAEDFTLPSTTFAGDISVGEFCRARLGDEITDRLIAPLVAGINASDVDRLSLASAAPQLAAAAHEGGSFLEALQRTRARVGATLGSAGADEPVFFGLPGGIARIIDELVATLPPESLHLNHPIHSLDQLSVDHVIVSVPAMAAARLLADRAPDASDLLSQIDYASVAQVTVELPIDSVERELDASGILCPVVDGGIMTAATWFSTKWEHYKRPGTVLIRMTSGRYGDTRAIELTDDELIETLLGELSAIIPISGPPSAVRVHRWLDALPQYTPGHAERVDAIMRAVSASAPSIHLVGAAYDGIGLPACIGGARRLVERIVA